MGFLFRCCGRSSGTGEEMTSASSRRRPLLIIACGRHPPRRRGIQYAAASRFNQCVSGILDRPPSRAMTSESVLAARFARGFANSLPLSRTEGAGNAGCALHPRSRVPKVCTLAHTSIQGSGNTPTSPAQWLYGLLRALPGGAGLLSPSPCGKLPARLGASIAAPGPHDLAVRLCSSVRTLTRA